MLVLVPKKVKVREAEADLISKTKDASREERTMHTDQPNYRQAG